MTLKIFQSIPVNEIEDKPENNCTICFLKNVDCVEYMKKHGTFCVFDDVPIDDDSNVIYQEVR